MKGVVYLILSALTLGRSTGNAVVPTVAMDSEADDNVTTIITTTIDPICGNLPNGAYVPHPNDCSKFYECSNGVAVPEQCPPDTEWNVEKNACDSPWNVHCNVSTLVPTSTTTLDPICGGKPDGSFVAHPTDCTKFYECSHGQPIEKQCPANTEWAQDELACDLPRDTNSCTRTSTTTAIPDPICGGKPDGSYFAHPTDCTKFYECINGEPIEKQCPFNTEWVETELACDVPHGIYSCSKNSSTTIAPNRICGGKPDGSYFAHPTDCTKFYECLRGEPIEKQCPAYTVWVEDVLTCEFPQSSNSCNLQITCATSADGTYFSNPDDCTKFYKCLKGEIVDLQCPYGTAWNQLIHSCDFDANVACFGND